MKVELYKLHRSGGLDEEKDVRVRVNDLNSKLFNRLGLLTPRRETETGTESESESES